MKKCIIAFLLLSVASLTVVTGCYGDKQTAVERERSISNSLSILQSSASWQTGKTNIVWALDVITRENLTNAIPFLIPHISFSFGEAPDTTSGNLFYVYPVLGCLRRLGKPTVGPIIDYVRSPGSELTSAMIEHLRLLLIMTEGQEQANQMVASAIENESKPESAKRLRLLLVTSSNSLQK